MPPSTPARRTMPPPPPARRTQSPPPSVIVVEKLVPRLRGVSHAVAFVLAIAAAVVAVALASTPLDKLALSVYGVGLMALFGGSALYHRWPGPPRFKRVLQRIDHSTIFVFIAASYTPIALVVMHGPLRWVVLGVAWA